MTFVVPDRSRWCLPELLAVQAETHADRPFLSFALGERDLTYGEVAAATDVVAAGLARLGVGPGDRVLLMMRNRAEFVLTWLGAARLGAVQVPINVDYRGAFLEHLANTAAAAVLVVEDALLDSVAASSERLAHLRTVVVVGEPAPLPGRLETLPFASLLEEGEPPRSTVVASDVGAIHFTSGTSGPSKGAVLPHALLHLLSERNRELLDLRAGDTYLTELPLFHINAQMSVYSALLVGARVRIEQRFSASAWLDRVRASNATHTSLLGVMLSFILKQPPRPEDADNALRRVWSVPCPPDLATAFLDRFGLEQVVTSYGSTEVGMVARRTLDAPPGSVGRVDPDLYATRVVDGDDEDVAPGEVGELLVRPLLPGRRRRATSACPSGRSRHSVTCGSTRATRRASTPTGTSGSSTGSRTGSGGEARTSRRSTSRTSSSSTRRSPTPPSIAVPADEEGGEDEIKAVVVGRARSGARRRRRLGLVRRGASLLRRPPLRRDPAGAAEDADGESAQERAEGGGDHTGDERPRPVPRRRPPLRELRPRRPRRQRGRPRGDPGDRDHGDDRVDELRLARSRSARRLRVDLDERRLVAPPRSPHTAAARRASARARPRAARRGAAACTPRRPRATARRAVHTRSGTSPPKWLPKYASAASESNGPV